MNISFSSRRVIVSLVLGLLLLASIVLIKGPASPQRSLVATFTSTTSLYEGARVKVLGVEVGRVTSITVAGTAVRVGMSYDSDVQLPADVHALIVPPSIVGDRFVQLTPAYVSGPTLQDGATLGRDRTGVPLELDDTFRELDGLAVTLGPDGVNKDGALSQLVSSTADNLRGNGRQLNQTLRDTSQLLATLAGSSDDIGATIDNLAVTTDTFAGKDDDLRKLVTALRRVSTDLDENGEEISTSVEQLDESLDLLSEFLSHHRKGLGEATGRLESTTATLAAHNDQLATLLKWAPVGLTTLIHGTEATNWDPENPSESVLNGRTSSAILRGALFDELDTQLGFVLSGICASAPADVATRLAPLCNLLGTLGEEGGATLSQLLRAALGASGEGATSLEGLLGGVG